QGADLLLNINASPFRQTKQAERLQTVSERARRHQLPILYCNLVGGQDELVFDGGSMVVDAEGEVQVQVPFFEEILWPLYVDRKDGRLVITGEKTEVPDTDA